MIDAIAHKPLTVEAVEDGGAILDLPESQLEQVKAVFDAHNVRYWIDEDVVSCDGGPETALIIISQNEDPARVQRLLDSIP